MTMDKFMQEAIAEARRGLEEGGIPIGSVLVLRGEIVARGHNMRVQRGSAILHAEMACIENAGRLTAKEYNRSRGVDLTVLNDPECIELMRKFITDFPQLWNEDIGV